MFYVDVLWTLYVRFPYSCMGMLHIDIFHPTYFHNIPKLQTSVYYSVFYIPKY